MCLDHHAYVLLPHTHTGSRTPQLLWSGHHGIVTPCGSFKTPQAFSPLCVSAQPRSIQPGWPGQVCQVTQPQGLAGRGGAHTSQCTHPWGVSVHGGGGHLDCVTLATGCAGMVFKCTGLVHTSGPGTCELAWRPSPLSPPHPAPTHLSGPSPSRILLRASDSHVFPILPTDLRP
jgi:hypothetical protein